LKNWDAGVQTKLPEGVEVNVDSTVNLYKEHHETISNIYDVVKMKLNDIDPELVIRPVEVDGLLIVGIDIDQESADLMGDFIWALEQGVSNWFAPHFQDGVCQTHLQQPAPEPDQRKLKCLQIACCGVEVHGGVPDVHGSFPSTAAAARRVKTQQHVRR
jgi:hypothetical protein